MRQLDIPYYIELQRRIKDILLYASCHQDNFDTYSIKIENLFVDICAFFDSICQTTIVEKNNQGHTFSNAASIRNLSDKLVGREYFNMGDYRSLLEVDLSLSSKELNLNVYEDNFYGNPMNYLPQNINGFKIKPFDNWGSGSLDWWSAFTKLKHNRLANIKEASLKRTIHALGATYIILSLKNETEFKQGDVTIELYEIFLPLYWQFSGRKMEGIIMWK